MNRAVRDAADPKPSDDQAPPGPLGGWTAVASACAAGVLLGAGALLTQVLNIPRGAVLLWVSLGVGMVFGAHAAWESIRRGRFDIDVLMVVGAGFAAAIGHPGEGALLLFLFVLAGGLEDLAMARTRREVEALHAIMPREAIAWRDGEWRPVDPSVLRAGDRIKIRPGDRVPADAEVTSGATSMDQSAITGESLPRDVGPGDALYAGTINTDDPIEAVVRRPAGESSLQRVLDLVTRARAQREPVQRTIDRLSQPYAILVMAGSAAVLLLWWLALGREPRESVYVAITLLIVASPCALIIATPTATLCAIARAARSGVLFKGGQAIERLARAGAVCFDKTGTLTFGRPRVFEVHAVAWSDAPELLAVAAGLEADSTHPIARAIVEEARRRGVEPARVERVDHTAGRGMSGVVNGAPVRLGSYAHAESLIPACLRGRVKEVLAEIQHRGRLGVVVARGGDDGAGQAAVVIMADQVRPGAATLVRRLHDLGVRPVRMLTGDNRATAEHVARDLGIDQVDAELLPEDKVRIVRSMKAEPGRAGGVAVIGDGVNDAPALALADASIAVGSIGSDAALESADIVLLSDDLGVVPWAMELARRARAIVRVNLIFAISVIAVMATLTVVGSAWGGRVPMSAGVLAHEGGTLLVVANSLRLLLRRGPQRDNAARAPDAPCAAPQRAPVGAAS